MNATHVWWYTARSSGMIAWLLLAASVVWGLAISTKTKPKKVRPNWMLDLHRYLGGLAMIFVSVHMLGLLLDGWIGVGPAQLLVPSTSSWRPGAVAWGITAMYLLAAVELTSLARKHLPRRLWRITHGLAFPTFAFSTIHGITAGTDAENPWFRFTAWAVSAVVIALTVVRLNQLDGDKPQRTPGPAGIRPVSYPERV